MGYFGDLYVYRDQWVRMGAHRELRGPMGTYEDLGEPIVTNRDL